MATRSPAAEEILAALALWPDLSARQLAAKLFRDINPRLWRDAQHCASQVRYYFARANRR